MKGLTLLEVLIAMVVLSIILTVVYGAYTSNVEAVNIARAQSQVYQTARIALDRMARDFESSLIATPVTNAEVTPGMVGENLDMDGRPADRINFTSLSHLSLTSQSPKTDLCEIGFDLAEDEESETLFLRRREDPVPDTDIKEGGTLNELAWDVGGLDIVYVDKNNERFDEWNTFEGDRKGILPSLIIITLTLKDPEGRERTFEMNCRPELAEKIKKQ